MRRRSSPHIDGVARRLPRPDPPPRRGAVDGCAAGAAAVEPTLGTAVAPTGGAGVVVGVIDTGIAPENPSFAGDRLASVKGADPYLVGNTVVFDKADGRQFRSARVTDEDWTRSDYSTKLVGAQFFAAGRRRRGLRLRPRRPVAAGPGRPRLADREHRGRQRRRRRDRRRRVRRGGGSRSGGEGRLLQGLLRRPGPAVHDRRRLRRKRPAGRPRPSGRRRRRRHQLLDRRTARRIADGPPTTSRSTTPPPPASSSP